MRCETAISCSAAIVRLLGGLAGVGLGDPGGLADPGGLGAAEVGEVAAVVGDVLDLERVEDQALAGERVLRLVGHPLREGRAVADDLLDGQAADDRAQRAGEHLLGERLDVLLLGEEPLGGEPDLVGVAADLDDRDALDVELDALAGHRAADLHRDAAAGEVHGGELLHERHHEGAAAEDHLLPRQVGGQGPVSGLSTALPLRPVTMKAWLGPATL